MTLPSFETSGNLPAGVYLISWNEFVAIFGGGRERKRLIAGCFQALKELRAAGCRTAYLDGSFATDKEGVYGVPPNDYDGCWDVAGVDPVRLDPVLLDFSHQRAAQKAKYFGELFPASFPAAPSGQTYLEFFQTDKHTGKSKGIIQLNLRDLP